jgi:predicted porin
MGLRADYNFSKMTRVYLAYENHKTGFDYVATSAASAATGDRTIGSVGLKQSF